MSRELTSLAILLLWLLAACESGALPSHRVQVPVKLVFTVQPTASIAGAAIRPAVAVTVLDVHGNVVTSANTLITLTIGNNPTGSTLSGTPAVAAVNGVATFSSLSLDRTGTGYTLTAEATGLSSVSSRPFQVTLDPAKLAFKVQPSNTRPGFTIAPAVQVSVVDVEGNTVESASTRVTVVFGINPSGGTLAGTTTVAVVNGVATFSNLSIDNPGTGYTLTASANQLNGATSEAFAVIGLVGRIAFVSERDGNREIYTVNADGTGLVRVTNDPANDEAPAWSPDGSRIAFISDRSGGASEVYVMNADGSHVVRRTFTASQSQDPSWSPDGTKIVYSTISDGSANLWSVDPDVGTPSLLFSTPGWEGHPAWSPDGTRLALVSDWFAYDFVYDIHLINANGSGFTALTNDIFDHVDYLRPSWAPDGARIAVAITKPGAAFDQYITQLGVMNPDGSGLTPLIGAATWAKSSWSPDGESIAFTSAGPGRLDVSWVGADGRSSGTIIANGWDPDWH